MADHWQEHPDYPLADWKQAVVNDETRLGYHEWVDDMQWTEEAERTEQERNQENAK